MALRIAAVLAVAASVAVLANGQSVPGAATKAPAASAAKSNNGDLLAGLLASLGDWVKPADDFVQTATEYGKLMSGTMTFLTSPSSVYSEIVGMPRRAEDAWAFAQRKPLEAATRAIIFGIIIATWFFTKPKDVIRASGLTAAQQEDLIEDWEPEPLVPRAPRGTYVARPATFVVREQRVKTVLVEGRDTELLNCASADFLNVAGDPETKRVAKAALDVYTVGSCGPRGFYGTTDAHLSLEAALADVIGCEETITYSDATATVASAIPAFAKRQDVVFLDDAVNHAVQTGCTLSRCKVVRFRHNDMADLERAVKGECGSKRAPPSRRYFIVVEGIYANRGDICPLPEILAIARRFRVRTIVDDSLAFGVLGKRGRGTAEHFGINPLDVDITVASMATSLGSVGGFCYGSDEVVDHQRISGAGYVFSASLPPFLCATAEAALRRFTADATVCSQLRDNARTLRSLLELSRGRLKVVSSFEESPVIHVRLSWHSDRSVNDAHRIEEARAESEDPESLTRWKYAPRRSRPALRRFQGVEDDDLDRVVAEAADRGVLVARSRYLVSDKLAPANSIRIHVSAALTNEDLQKIAVVMEEAVEAAFEARDPAAHAAPARADTLRKRR
ncbi:hypothetical protein FNF27_01866 [Cafeteria roenbergensis]|uniref:serine C-palmitoyltransferase n=1 Tax=Cafeteria roenbergensis TaxID=33653 RepID=A0A5A8EFD2_CAFRO|nr:hypothetical protein FNF27_01866 [Cafeteria roenbergensis]